jgi:hypothetical protein
MPHPLFAFGLLNLPMLGWLAIAAAPILIHLWNRRHHSQTAWAAMEFLLAAIQLHTRRMLLEQWLLLAIRTAEIVLVVLAVSEPYWKRPGLASGSGGTAHRMLAIDGSYSMGFKPTDQSRFEKAKELAKKIVEDSPQGDAFTLLLMSSPPRIVVGKPALERAEILREIDALQSTQTDADLPGTLTVIEQLIPKIRHDMPQIVQQEIYFITDMQRVSWAPQLRQNALADFRRRSAALAELAAIVILDVGQPGVDNLAVTALSLTDPVAIAGREVNFWTTIRNFGRQAKNHQLVGFYADGRRVQQKYVDVPSGGEITMEFVHRFETLGDHAVEIRASGDELEVDNHRYLAVSVRQAIRVLCIDGRPSGERYRGATDYLVKALAPQSERPEFNVIKPEVAAESSLVEREISRYDCIFLCNVAQFTSHEVILLRNYLQRGGNIIFFLGDQVIAERYNREMAGETIGDKASRAREGGILPAQLGEVIADPQVRIDPLAFQHPIAKVFRGRGEYGLLTTPIFNYFKLKLRKDSSARVVLAATNGDPLMVEEQIERGYVIVAATSTDISWAAMPLWPSFLPLVQEMVSFCMEGEFKQHNLEVGDQMIVTSHTASVDVPIIVQTPDGRSQTAKQLASDGNKMLFVTETSRSGIYSIEFGQSSEPNRLYAVNVDTAESNLAQLSPDELQEDIWRDVTFLHQTTWRDIGRPQVAASLVRTDLQIKFLYVVLSLLILETFISWRFGHHRT